MNASDIANLTYDGMLDCYLSRSSDDDDGDDSQFIAWFLMYSWVFYLSDVAEDRISLGFMTPDFTNNLMDAYNHVQTVSD